MSTDVEYSCPVCGARLLSAAMRCSGSFLDADHPSNIAPVPVPRETDWVSSCCRAAMTTAGGDGTHGSPCWAVCRACSNPTDPVRALADAAAFDERQPS